MQHNKYKIKIENKMVGLDIKSGMNRAGGVMKIRENLARLSILCAVKKGCAIKIKAGNTSNYSRSFTSQAEQFFRTCRSKNHNRIFSLEGCAHICAHLRLLMDYLGSIIIVLLNERLVFRNLA